MANQALMANAIRALAMDAVQQANSGHPGAPMGMADMAVALWGEHLRYNPANPHWFDRDRFVLSNGHASMLLYAVLHLTGYDLPIGELKNFRQLHSKTAGHPEVDVTPGVETTTGPLGQGITNAVGFALAEKLLAAEFNRKNHDIVDHHTYAFLGDGCMMEGISHEACALAGAWHLNKLIALYDDNGISIDGQVKPWFIDNTEERFKAYGWNVIGPIDGNDAKDVSKAIAKAKKEDSKPTLIICKTQIGKGSPNRANTAKAHGEPLGAEEITLTRAALEWPYPAFEVPQEAYADWDHKAEGARAEAAWNDKFAAYAEAFPELGRRVHPPHEGRAAQELPPGGVRHRGGRPHQGRNRGQPQGQPARARGLHRRAARNARRQRRPHRLQPHQHQEHRGPALRCEDRCRGHGRASRSSPPRAPKTSRKPDSTADKAEPPHGVIGRHINYGVREFGMAAIMNGVALHGGFIPYGGTFLTFSDYSRNAIRMAALMKRRVVHVFTHDSIGLGEDGPTHQSIEHAASLRLIPNLDVWRPGDTAETAVAWAVALQNQSRPTALLLSRQNIAYAPKGDLGDISRGAYVLSEPEAVGLKSKKTAAVIIATGSEVQLALAAQKLLAEKKIAVRVVSMPSTTTFDRQDVAYKKSVLPKKLPRIAVEMGCTGGWWKYGCAAVVGIDSYGESAPAPALFKHFGFTAENVAATVEAALRD